MVSSRPVHETRLHRTSPRDLLNMFAIGPVGLTLSHGHRASSRHPFLQPGHPSGCRASPLPVSVWHLTPARPSGLRTHPGPAGRGLTTPSVTSPGGHGSRNCVPDPRPLCQALPTFYGCWYLSGPSGEGRWHLCLSRWSQEGMSYLQSREGGGPGTGPGGSLEPVGQGDVPGASERFRAEWVLQPHGLGSDGHGLSGRLCEGWGVGRPGGGGGGGGTVTTPGLIPYAWGPLFQPLPCRTSSSHFF